MMFVGASENIFLPTLATISGSRAAGRSSCDAEGEPVARSVVRVGCSFHVQMKCAVPAHRENRTLPEADATVTSQARCFAFSVCQNRGRPSAISDRRYIVANTVALQAGVDREKTELNHSRDIERTCARRSKCCSACAPGAAGGGHRQRKRGQIRQPGQAALDFAT